jgi:hypothetical protein
MVVTHNNPLLLKVNEPIVPVAVQKSNDEESPAHLIK